MTIRLLFFFICFCLIPGLGYQYVQDDLRQGASASPGLDYFLGIAPNLFGGVSLTAGLIVIGREMAKAYSPRQVHIGAAVLSLLGLWLWEAMQIYLPNGTFDWHDIAWTVPGVATSWLMANVLLRHETK
ncbi:MAG: hypothetical protein MRY72_00275 [Aquisalinus sp.]|nr:hypothetical protein [Aquisalinus sp.]